MKDIAFQLYYDARNNLLRMQKAKMSLSDRIAYEKAIVQLETMERILRRLTNNI